jgi:hypothetical protein
MLTAAWRNAIMSADQPQQRFVQAEMNSLCNEVNSQAALNDRELMKSSGGVESARDKLETSKLTGAAIKQQCVIQHQREQEQVAKVCPWRSLPFPAFTGC